MMLPENEDNIYDADHSFLLMVFDTSRFKVHSGAVG